LPCAGFATSSSIACVGRTRAERRSLPGADRERGDCASGLGWLILLTPPGWAHLPGDSGDARRLDWLFLGHTQAHFARSVLESVAYEYAYYLGILRELIPGLSLTEARVVGGGARSPLWNQIKADVLGVPYQPLKGNEFGSWGSAMIAGKAAGVFTDLAEVAYAHAIAAGKRLEPDAATHDVYQSMVKQYIEWQKDLAATFKTMQ